MVCDGNGIPLAVHLADGRSHDLMQAEATLAALRVPCRSGCPRTRPDGLAADKGYDSRAFREYLRRRGIRHSIPERRDRVRYRHGRPPRHRPELSNHRWVIERLFRAFQGFRRLITRFERHAFIHLGLLFVASIMITLRHF